MINLAILFGGVSPEHKVSILSARSIYKKLNKNKYRIFPIYITEDGYWIELDKSKKILTNELDRDEIIFKKNNLIDNKLIKILQNDIELVFPVLHGPYGEDGKIQGFLEILGVNYIGCNLISSAIGMDKAVMKKIFSYHNLPQSEFVILNKREYKSNKIKKLFDNLSSKIDLPFFVKPANMGSSIGINKVNNISNFAQALEEAFKYDNKIIIEENIDGKEIELAVIEKNSRIVTSVPGEIKLHSNFYDYNAKYKDFSTELIIPANISKNLINKIESLSIKAFRILGCTSIARFDFFINEKSGELFINEINTMPGFTETSMFPMLFKNKGIKYEKLLDEIIVSSITNFK